MTETPKRLYDLVFLVVPDKDEQGAAAVVEEFRRRRISIPFPQREVRLLNEAVG